MEERVEGGEGDDHEGGGVFCGGEDQEVWECGLEVVKDESGEADGEGDDAESEDGEETFSLTAVSV